MRCAAGGHDAPPSLLARCVWKGALARLGLTLGRSAASGLTALSLALTLAGASVAPAAASELDVLSSPTPSTANYVLDDAKLLSRSAITELTKLAAQIEADTGYRVSVVTLRKLQFETDAFAFADKVIEHWYPTAADGSKKAVLILVKASKEGALVAGPELGKKLGSALMDSISGDNIPTFSEQEKFGEALSSSLRRMQAKLAGQADPGAPTVEVAKSGSTFKSKKETEEKRGSYVTVVGGLLVIAFVVPMVQYYGYVNKGAEEEPVVARGPVKRGAKARK